MLFRNRALSEVAGLLVSLVPVVTHDVQSGWTVDVAVGTLIFADDAKVDDREYSHADPTGQPISNANYQAEYELSAWSAAFEVSKAF